MSNMAPVSTCGHIVLALVVLHILRMFDLLSALRR